MKRNTQKWQHKDLSKYLPFQIWPSIKALVISSWNDLWCSCLMTVEKTVCGVRGSWVFYSSSWNREKVDWRQNMRHCKLFFVRGQLHWFPSQRHSFSLFAPHRMIEAKAFGFSDAVMVHDCTLTKQSFTLYRRIKEGEERSLLCSQTLTLLLVKCWLEGLLTSRSNTVTRDRCDESAFAQANLFSCDVV